jgi:hypothetical protein
MGKRSRRNKDKLPRQSSISPNAQKDCIQDAQNAASWDKWMDNVLISLAGTDFFNVNPKTNTIDRYMYDRIHMLGECGNYKFNGYMYDRKLITRYNMIETICAGNLCGGIEQMREADVGGRCAQTSQRNSRSSSNRGDDQVESTPYISHEQYQEALSQYRPRLPQELLDMIVVDMIGFYAFDESKYPNKKFSDA